MGRLPEPPGPTSTPTGRRVGSEIYYYDLASDMTRRLTFDLPDRSIPKGFASIGTDLAVWLEPCAGCGEDFASAQEFCAAARVLVKFDLETRERCRLEDTPYGGFALARHGPLITTRQGRVHDLRTSITARDPDPGERS